ncbi:SMC-Scp complex subunit ScpB [Kribbella sp. NPDC023972]|uniref:SMC-Scp complex subunit ScpB n=1 Tax=Kribbella sp. NPDC023972 TaxID=3154795 RepID=UPI0033EC5199
MTDHPTPDPTSELSADAADTPEPEVASFVDSGAEEPAPAADELVGSGEGDSTADDSADSGLDSERDDVPGDEDHLPPGQTAVPVGDEVVIDDDTMRRALEAILMVTDEPLPVLTLARAVGRPTGDVSAALETLAAEYAEQGRGFDLREVGGGWRYYTRPEAAPYVERFVLDGQQARLTQAALETLAVVAYKQPVSRARVSAIRGVNVDGVMRTLVARGLVEEAGADTESQATLYRTTSYFLERMGMQSLDDLPELAPYLPDMDDIEDELAAQTLPPATPEAAEGSEQAPAAEAETPEQEPAADSEPTEEPSEQPARAAEDGPGIDGDLATDEPVELDVEHEPGDLDPSQEIEPADEVSADEAIADEVSGFEGEADESELQGSQVGDRGRDG